MSRNNEHFTKTFTVYVNLESFRKAMNYFLEEMHLNKD